MEKELQARMEEARKEMEKLQAIQENLKKQDKEFTVRMDGLRGKLEASSKALTAAEQRKAKLLKEQQRIANELQEAEGEIVRHTQCQRHARRCPWRARFASTWIRRATNHPCHGRSQET